MGGGAARYQGLNRALRGNNRGDRNANRNIITSYYNSSYDKRNRINGVAKHQRISSQGGGGF